MAKEEIRKLLENSKKDLDSDYDGFVKSVQEDLNSFKKKNLRSYLTFLSHHDLNMDPVEPHRK